MGFDSPQLTQAVAGPGSCGAFAVSQAKFGLFFSKIVLTILSQVVQARKIMLVIFKPVSRRREGDQVRPPPADLGDRVHLGVT